MRRDLSVVVVWQVTESVEMLDELITSQDEGPALGSTYAPLACKGCHSKVGKVFRTTSAALDEIRDTYSLDCGAISIYCLGTTRRHSSFPAWQTSMCMSPPQEPGRVPSILPLSRLGQSRPTWSTRQRQHDVIGGDGTGQMRLGSNDPQRRPHAFAVEAESAGLPARAAPAGVAGPSSEIPRMQLMLIEIGERLQAVEKTTERIKGNNATRGSLHDDVAMTSCEASGPSHPTRPPSRSVAEVITAVPTTKDLAETGEMATRASDQAVTTSGPTMSVDLRIGRAAGPVGIRGSAAAEPPAIPASPLLTRGAPASPSMGPLLNETSFTLDGPRAALRHGTRSPSQSAEGLRDGMTASARTSSTDTDERRLPQGLAAIASTQSTLVDNPYARAYVSKKPRPSADSRTRWTNEQSEPAPPPPRAGGNAYGPHALYISPWPRQPVGSGHEPDGGDDSVVRDSTHLSLSSPPLQAHSPSKPIIARRGGTKRKSDRPARGHEAEI
ncbi:unnamed protein product [Parajaminaea phylloscopi]